jgi:hypothetical protein
MQRQAQLEERIIAPENDDFAPSKGRNSKAITTKRLRTASSRRFTSNLTPGDLDGKFRQDDDEEDLSAVCVARLVSFYLFHSAKSNVPLQCEKLPQEQKLAAACSSSRSKSVCC